MREVPQTMAASTAIDVGGITRPSGQLDAVTALRPYAGRLGVHAAAHLLRRAGFGGAPEEIERYSGMTAGAAVESLIALPSAAGIASPVDLTSDERPARRVEALQLWWLNRMLTTTAPLQEKMTLYFHGHFTSRATPRFPWITYNQNALFRKSALGNLHDLTRDVSKDPAMLIYLDGQANVAAHPNENYARELMELFTLGVDQYTEEDVRESARAWTGWRLDLREGSASFNPALHDAGVKQFLGQRGNFDGDDIVDIIFAQPQCARFFATSLLSWFVYDDPEPALVESVAHLLRHHDFELAPVVATILRSEVFYSPRAYRALVKSPVEFVVGSYKTLALDSVDSGALVALRQMGQNLFSPPSVAGWPGGANWLTSGTMIARQNFLSRLLNSQTSDASAWIGDLSLHPTVAAQRVAHNVLQNDVAPAALREIETYLGGSGSAALAELSAENFAQRASGAVYLAMATPAYELN
jgi:uncharacterized protein (DUF1800 family)